MENLHGKRGNPQTDEEGFVIKLCHSTATQEVESPNCSSIQETEKVGGSDMLAEPTPSVGTECVVFSPPLSPDLTPVVSTAIVMVSPPSSPQLRASTVVLSPPLMHDPMPLAALPITMVSSCETECHTSPLHPTQSLHTSSVEKVTNSKRIPEIEDFRYTGNASKAIGDSNIKRKLAESVGGKEKAIGDSSIKHQLRESAGGKERRGDIDGLHGFSEGCFWKERWSE